MDDCGVSHTGECPVIDSRGARATGCLAGTHPPSSVVEIRSHSPLAVSDDSEPEPDIAVVPAGDYRTSHPNRAVLVIEVAETSLLEDRGIKTALYATAEIPEFWIVNLTEKIVEVHRRPGQGRYAEIQRIDRRGIVGPAAFPEVQIRVGDLIP